MSYTPHTHEIDGKTIHLIDGTARSGRPDWNKFHESKMNAEGAPIDERLYTTLYFKDENGETVKYRTTFWGEAALDAKGKLYDSQRVVKIKVRNAKISSSPYFDAEGNELYSLNINFKSQFKLLEESEYWGGMGSEPTTTAPAIPDEDADADEAYDVAPF